MWSNQCVFGLNQEELSLNTAPDKAGYLKLGGTSLNFRVLLFPPAPQPPKAAMNDAEYVLCKRKERLWPAKVLTKDCATTKQQAHKAAATHLWVELLHLNEQLSIAVGHLSFSAFLLSSSKDLRAGTRVPFEDVELLTEETIERITVQLEGRSGKCRDVVDELIYRRVLREALDYLRQAAPGKEISPSKMGRSKTVAQKETKERSSVTRVASRRPPSSQKDMRRRRGKTCEALAVPDVMGTQNKPGRRSRQTTEGSSSAKSPTSKSRVLLGNGELEGRPHRAPKTKTAAVPKKVAMLKSSSRPPASRRSPRFSKADERYRECKSSWERSSPSCTSKCFARTSTPARASRSGAKLTPGNKCSDKAGLRRNLLGSPVKCPSAEEVKDLSEKEAFPPRKYSKDLGGQRHPRESEGTPQEQTLMATSLCWEGKCASHHKDPPSSPSPVGPVLDGTQEEGPCLCADRPENSQCCDLEGKGLESPSDPALRLSPISESHFSSTFRDEEEAEDEEELPRIFLHQEPCSMEPGMLVWCKLPRYPYWPAVVKSVMRKAKKAIVHLIEKAMDDKKSKGFSISLKKLKHFDCEEKQTRGASRVVGP
uniref:Uncharacterized protein n=1 Tax=Sphaerodactylus townsendi TaxID=933632 RepID=A0ACB8F1Z3_9SAUR